MATKEMTREEKQEKLTGLLVIADNLRKASAEAINCLGEVQGEINDILGRNFEAIDQRSPEPASTSGQQGEPKAKEGKSAKARRELIEAANPDAEDGLDDADVIYAANYLKVMRNWSGPVDTPIENFIFDLVNDYAWSPKGLTPERIESDVAELKSDFACTLSIARKFAREYPELVDADEDEEDEEHEEETAAAE